MATVTTPSGETLEGVTGALLDYYRGEANTVDGYVIEGDESAVTFPRVFDGEQYLEAPASDEPRVGYSVPPNSDGTFGPATLGPDGASAEVDGKHVDLTPDDPQSEV